MQCAARQGKARRFIRVRYPRGVLTRNLKSQSMIHPGVYSRHSLRYCCIMKTPFLPPGPLMIQRQQSTLRIHDPVKTPVPTTITHTLQPTNPYFPAPVPMTRPLCSPAHLPPLPPPAPTVLQALPPITKPKQTLQGSRRALVHFQRREFDIRSRDYSHILLLDVFGKVC